MQAVRKKLDIYKAVNNISSFSKTLLLTLTLLGYFGLGTRGFICAQNTVAYYPFCQTTEDWSGNQNHGKAQGEVTYRKDRFNNNSGAIAFNGTNAYITVPNSSSLRSPTSALSITGWFYIEAWASNGEAPILNRAGLNQYGVTVAANRIKFYTGRSILTADYNFALNQWYFFAVVYRSNQVQFYVNNNFIGSKAGVGNLTPDNFPLEIGRDISAQPIYLKGALDDIFIFDKALSFGEVQQLYRFSNLRCQNFKLQSCLNDNVWLFARPGGKNYQWKPEGAPFAIQSNYAGINVRAAGTYYCKITFPDNTERIDTFEVELNPAPEIKITSDVESVCRGNAVTLTASGGVMYEWAPSADIPEASRKDNPLIVKPKITTIYRVTGYDELGCKGTAEKEIKATGPRPTIEANLESPFCKGETVTLSAESNPNYTYLWSINNQTTSSITVQANDQAVYVVITDKSVTPPCIVKTEEFLLITSPRDIPVKLTIKEGSAQFCEGDSAILEVGPNHMFYDWLLDGTKIAEGKTNQLVVKKGGKYSVVAYNRRCGIEQRLQQPVEITVWPKPQPTITYVIDTVDSDKPVYFSFSVSPASINSRELAIRWEFGDGFTSTESNPKHIYERPGTYKVTLTLTTKEGCKESTTVTVRVPERDYLQIPNVITPNGDGINDYLVISGVGIINFRMHIYDQWGRLIWETQNINDQWNGKTMGGSNLATGTYFYIVQAETLRNQKIRKTGSITVLK
ncbi:MAG: gliding motility-associated C-terminal domain-containing protein [Bacteroidia bacterium]|nr:gliding motility-associated C-terminal domain-containing protein [Bacteroidia bacterium]MDW8157356.1 gliding motility-associated C-terminal domain-containing protein [Bacteroidia bacterium]